MLIGNININIHRYVQRGLPGLYKLAKPRRVLGRFSKEAYFQQGTIVV